jgi:hypothetical protein
MTRRGAFGREWSLIKLARGWRIREISGEILSELVATADPGLQRRIQDIARDIGSREATRFLDRLPPETDAATVLENFLLVTGVHCAVTPTSKGKVLYISTEPDEIIAHKFRGHEILRSFLAGAAATIAPSAAITDEADALVVTVPDRPPFGR